MAETKTEPRYRLYVNAERTIKVEVWPTGTYIAFRDTPSHTWGPPVELAEEETN